MEKEKQIKANLSKCSGCGSNLKFDPESQSLKCENCDNTSTFKQEIGCNKHTVGDKTTDYSGYAQWKQDNKVMRCDNCGAKLVLNNLEYATNCPYCETPMVSSETLPSIVPDGVVPFMFDEHGAETKFIKNVKKMFYVNGKFKKTKTRKTINALYFPSFVFNAKSISQYSGVLEEVETERDSNGNISHNTRTFSISGTENCEHKDITIETSSYITGSELKNVLPYQMEKVKTFNQNFILGYRVEHFDTALETCYEQAKKEMNDQIRNSVLSHYSYTYVKSLDINSAFSDENYSYIILPVYKFEYKFNNKNYISYMNGQTGKVGGKFPLSIIKIAFTVIIVLAIILAIGFLALMD